MYLGWTQVAFDEEMAGDVGPADVAGRALVTVRDGGETRVFDGRCPHRGAHLGWGARLDGGSLICAFHGYRVHLGDRRPRDRGEQPFCVGEHPALASVGGIFVLLDERLDTKLRERLEQLSRTHIFRPAFTRDVNVPPEYIVENVLDIDHFTAVHGLKHPPQLTVRETDAGSLRVDGQLDFVRPNIWQGEAESTGTEGHARFSAEVFSPTLVITELGSSDPPHVVITAATPTAAGGSVARVTIGLALQAGSKPPTVREFSSLVSGSRTAFEQDSVVWEHLDTTVTPHYRGGDSLAQSYRAFCERFREYAW